MRQYPPVLLQFWTVLRTGGSALTRHFWPIAGVAILCFILPDLLLARIEDVWLPGNSGKQQIFYALGFITQLSCAGIGLAIVVALLAPGSKRLWSIRTTRLILAGVIYCASIMMLVLFVILGGNALFFRQDIFQTICTLLVAFACYHFVHLWLVMPLVATEHLGIWQAIKISRRMIKEHKLITLACLSIFVFVISLVVMLPSALPGNSALTHWVMQGANMGLLLLNLLLMWGLFVQTRQT